MLAPNALTDSPIFIVGPGRSGTTLVRSLLSAHSRISITPEMQYMQWIDEREDVRKAPANFECFWQEYTSWVRFADLGVDADRCLELTDLQGARNFENIFRAVLTAYMERTGKIRVGEKSPSHVRYIGTLLEWFPNARILVMQRDPRAVVSSQLGTPYVQDRITEPSLRDGHFVNSRMREVVRYADDWTMIFRDLVPQWHSDRRVCVVSYEKLARDPEGEIRSICDFLGETYEEAMLTGRGDAGVPLPAGKTSSDQLEQWRREHHAKSLRPVSTHSLDKWKRSLSKTEIAIVEARCIRGMQRTRYEPSTSAAKRFEGRLLSRGFLAAERGESIARQLAKSIRDRLPLLAISAGQLMLLPLDVS